MRIKKSLFWIIGISLVLVGMFSVRDFDGRYGRSINGDAKGNFYTTETIDFGSGLYPVLQGNNSTNKMSSSITTGQCNSCHGVSTDKIWTN